MTEVNDAPDLLSLEDPDQFVVERTDLAKRVRASGERERAAEIKKLRRPPATAWALNRAARSEPTLITDLLGAGDRLRAAMRSAVQGDASAVRAAEQGERSAAGRIIDEAAQHLSAVRSSGADQARQTMAATLRAAVLDPDVADQLRRGALSADHDAPGFGLDLSGPELVLPERPAQSTPATAARVRGRVGPDPQEGEAAAAKGVGPPKAAAEAAAVAAAEGRATEARRRRQRQDVDKLARVAARLERDAVDSEDRATQARATADRARLAADEAQHALEQAQQAVESD